MYAYTHICMYTSINYKTLTVISSHKVLDRVLPVLARRVTATINQVLLAYRILLLLLVTMH